LRYNVYVEEMGRYRTAADHEHRRLAEPEDDTGWIFYARDGDVMVATGRLSWGAYGFSPRQIDQYELEPFLAEIPADRLLVGERATISPEYRGTNTFQQMMDSAEPFVKSHDIRIVFGCCEPHLLPLYIGMGQQPYASRNINSPEAGYLIPLVTFSPDVDALRGAGYKTRADELPQCVERALAQGGSVRSSLLSSHEDYWRNIHNTLDALHGQQISAFDGFTDDEAERCIARSNVIECAKGDRVLKRGGTARNIFVVLSGTLEVRDDDRVVGVLNSGDAFGEMAFLLERPRSFDVDAAADAKILSLSEGALRKMIAEDATVAAKLLLNLSKMLCVRLIRAD
jgi:hypothetical protein